MPYGWRKNVGYRYRKGGTYITQDASHKTLRIGLDLDRYSLNRTREKYSLPSVEADATVRLPFKDKSFTKVEIIFPLDELLIALTDQNNGLLREIKRITKKEVSIILDTDYFWRQGVYSNGKPIIVDHPHELIANNLKTNGLPIKEFREMTTDEVQALGTDISEGVSDWMQEMIRHKAWKIVASAT